MDDDPRWRELPPGRLIHVGADLMMTPYDIRSTEPAHALTRHDLTA
jgi:glutamine amidotransferase